MDKGLQDAVGCQQQDVGAVEGQRCGRLGCAVLCAVQQVQEKIGVAGAERGCQQTCRSTA